MPQLASNSSPLPRMFPSEKEILDNLITAVQAYWSNHNATHTYVGSVEVTPNDHEAAKKLNWLRVTTNTSKPPTVSYSNATEYVGELGEWVVLRKLYPDIRVKAVSLLSISPVTEPDLFVFDPTASGRSVADFSFDIKSSAAAGPAAYIQVLSHIKKGRPHTLAAVFKADKNVFDLYVIPEGDTAWELLKLYGDRWNEITEGRLRNVEAAIIRIKEKNFC